MRTTLILISNHQAKGEKDETTKCQIIIYNTDMRMKQNQTSDIKLK